MTNPPPYGYAPVAPPPPRPMLTSRQRRGALVAGAVGLFLLQLGFTAVMIPLALVLVTLLLFGVVNSLAGTRGGGTGWGSIWAEHNFDAAPWIPWLIAAVVFGVVIMVLAVLVSGWILRGHGVNRPRAVTWSAIGIGIVGQWVVGGTLGLVSNLASIGLQRVADNGGVLIGVAVAAVGSLVTTVLVGALSWWWMAHVFRAPDASDTQSLG